MLVLPSIGRDLSHFRLGDLVCVHAADAFASGMNLQHHTRRARTIHGKDAFQNIHDELHRSVIVVQQYDLVQRWLLELWLGFLSDQPAFMSCALFRHLTSTLYQLKLFIGWKARHYKA